MPGDSSESGGFMADAAKRITFWGSIAVWILGIVLALNAAYDSEYTSAGICLLASVAAMGVLSYTFMRR
ncbi:MAG: hypothetical protein IH872_02600 [Chloroflexi bacterium]|nr:hypothetical protein [Chloroflexota bacterium]